MNDHRQPGRPRGELRAMLDSWSHQNPSFTMGQAARSLGCSLKAVDNTLQRQLGDSFKVIGSTRTPEAKRPVAVYARADYVSDAMPLSGLVRVWA